MNGCDRNQVINQDTTTYKLLYRVGSTMGKHYIMFTVRVVSLLLIVRFLTMEQTRKLVLLLSSDPKVLSLPLVGL